MRVTPAVVIVPFLVLLLTWLSLRAIDPGAELFDIALGELDRFSTLENALYRDVFTARSGTLRNYDPLVREIKALHGSLARLRETAAIDSETTAALNQLVTSVDRQEELVEQFKSDNSLLRNSLAYFAEFSGRLGNPSLDTSSSQQVSALGAAILRLSLDTTPATANEVQDRLDTLFRQNEPASDDEAIRALVAHGRLLQHLLPATDSLVKSLAAAPETRDLDVLRALALREQS